MKPTISGETLYAPWFPVDSTGISGIVDQCFRHAPVRAQQAVEFFRFLIAELPFGSFVQSSFDFFFKAFENAIQPGTQCFTVLTRGGLR